MVGDLEWIATHVLTLLVVVTAVALLALLHDLVPAEGPVVRREAVGPPLLRDGIQHQRDVADGARGELVVVEPITAGGRGEHNVVPLETPRLTRVGEVMRRAKVVADLVSKCELGDLRRHAGVVVQKGDDAGVERALL